MHYLVFLKSRRSITDPETRKMVDEYKAFSEKVSLLFEDEAGSADDTKETFVLLTEHRWVLTHGWEYTGEIATPIHRMHETDYWRYEKRFERLDRSSYEYYPRPAKKLNLSRHHKPG